MAAQQTAEERDKRRVIDLRIAARAFASVGASTAQQYNAALKRLTAGSDELGPFPCSYDGFNRFLAHPDTNVGGGYACLIRTALNFVYECSGTMADPGEVALSGRLLTAYLREHPKGVTTPGAITLRMLSQLLCVMVRDGARLLCS